MKFTKNDLIEAMGLKVGDKINIETWRTTFTINNEYNLISDIGYPASSPTILVGEEFEIVRPKKKLGEKLCKNTLCDNCPLCKITCMYRYYKTLYEVLDNWYEKYNDKELYAILRARLDREVE